jgi:Holliday junction resolvase YEN1
MDWVPSIYKEIGPGKRVSLCKLAIDHLEQTGRPLRLAIDFAIWSFQAQAARGGANPAIRTLFYRLVRLLSLSIVPLFVFDGPNKPLFKRNKRSRGPGDSVSVAMAKRLLGHFGFHTHDAPGEAEAECALLQQQGVVDAVLSEDVDTIMFGCTVTLRNWSAEGTRAAKTPTHVSVYDVAELRQGETGLDREGMVLVALMSGGDYVPEGVPGCGVKVACEAARAGFGRRLCRIKRSDPEALARWREDLVEELRTNKSKFFRTKHQALTIPDEFPSVEVLRYYTHPVVSQSATVDRLKREFPTRREIDIAGLRAFTVETFDWVYKVGAVKFIRVLAPSLLVQALLNLSHEELESDDPEVRQEVEARIVRSISTRRTHFSTDATPELRISYMPNGVVGVDLDAEEDEVASTFGRSGLALNSDDEAEERVEDAEVGPKKVFDPLQPDLAWVPETVAKLGVPLAVEDWEEKQRKKQLGKTKKTLAKSSRKKASDMPTGALNKYVKTTKLAASASSKGLERPPFLASSQQSMPPLSQQVRGKSSTAALRDTEARKPSSTTQTLSNGSSTTSSRARAKPPRPSLDINPWTLASSQPTPKASRLNTTDTPAAVPEPIYISSSPAGPSSPQDSGHLQHTQSSTPMLPDDNSRNVPSLPYDQYSPSPSARKTATQSPRKPTRPSEEPPRRRPARPRRTPDTTTTAQASIKDFGRLSEAMGKRSTGMICETKVNNNPLSDSDDELDELHGLGRKMTAAPRRPGGATLSSRRSLSSKALGHEDGGGGGGSSTLSPRHGAEAVVEIPSSPPPAPPSPGAVSTRSKTTRLYMSRTSDAGYGYFGETEVSREAADRLIARQSREPGRRPGSRRIWRHSEVSILDLTGED